MSLRLSILWQTVFLAISAIASLLLGRNLPDRVPTHWGLDGQPNAWGSPAFAVWFGPVLVGLMLAFTLIIPWLPGGKNVGRFGPTYAKIMVLVSGLMTFLHFTILQATRGQNELPGTFLAGMFLFFAALGNLMGKVRPNRYVGVRTPWTLSSERVWEATHRRAAWLYTVCGIAGAILVLCGLPVQLAITFLIVFSCDPILDSFLLYQKMER